MKPTFTLFMHSLFYHCSHWGNTCTRTYTYYGRLRILGYGQKSFLNANLKPHACMILKNKLSNLSGFKTAYLIGGRLDNLNIYPVLLS